MSLLLLLGTVGIITISEILVAGFASYYTWQYIKQGYDQHGEVKWFHFPDHPRLRAFTAASIFIGLLVIFNFFGLVLLLIRTMEI